MVNSSVFVIIVSAFVECLAVLLHDTASAEDDLFLCCSCKRPPAKAKKSPVGNWLSFFHLGKSHSVSKRKLKRHPSEPNEIKSIALPGQITAAGTEPFSCRTFWSFIFCTVFWIWVYHCLQLNVMNVVKYSLAVMIYWESCWNICRWKRR